MQRLRPIEIRGEEVLANGDRAVWFLFKDQSFDVGRFYRRDGSWTGYYVDLLEPVRWQGDDPHTLQPLVDLFLDIWIAPNGEHLVLDEAEFDAAVEQGHIAPVQIERARVTLDELLESIRIGTFPPDEVRNFSMPSLTSP